MLVEDNDVFREALELLLTLGGEIEIVASEADGDSIVERCLELSPDVLLVDYRLPGLDGVQVTKLVRERCPDVSVVALTAAAEPLERQALIEAGASACIGKDEELEEIVSAIRRAASA